MFSTSALAGRQSGDEAVDCRPPRAAALVLNMSLFFQVFDFDRQRVCENGVEAHLHRMQHLPRKRRGAGVQVLAGPVLTGQKLGCPSYPWTGRQGRLHLWCGIPILPIGTGRWPAGQGSLDSILRLSDAAKQ